MNLDTALLLGFGGIAAYLIWRDRREKQTAVPASVVPVPPHQDVTPDLPIQTLQPIQQYPVYRPTPEPAPTPVPDPAPVPDRTPKVLIRVGKNETVGEALKKAGIRGDCMSPNVEVEFESCQAGSYREPLAVALILRQCPSGQKLTPEGIGKCLKLDCPPGTYAEVSPSSVPSCKENACKTNPRIGHGMTPNGWTIIKCGSEFEVGANGYTGCLDPRLQVVLSPCPPGEERISMPNFNKDLADHCKKTGAKYVNYPACINPMAPRPVYYASKPTQ